MSSSGTLKTNIEALTLRNGDYRRVLTTTKHIQVVVMNLRPGEEIGNEVHPSTTQFFRVEGGAGNAILTNKATTCDDGGEETTSMFRLKPGDALVVPPGVFHNITASDAGLKLYTIYSPPHHPPDTRQRSKPAE